MTTPVYLTKTWQFCCNAAQRTASSIADGARFQMWWICAFLTGNETFTDFDNNAIAGGSVLGKWTIYKSCNSLVADTSDNLHIGGTYTDTDWVRDTPGNAHSWVVLKSPVGMQDGPFYILLDWSTAANHQVSVSMSQNAFSTGGTTTAAPTATNSVTAATRPITLNGVQTAGRMRGTLCTDGNFIIQHSFDGTGNFDFFFAGCTLVETMEPQETHNFWLLWDHESSATGAPHTQNWQSFVIGPTMGRGPAGEDLTAGAITIVIPYAGGTPVYANIIPGRDATNNTFRNKQIIIITAPPTYQSERGVVSDIYLCPNGNAAWLSGDFLPNSGTGQFREFMRAMHFIVPANGVAQVL